MPRPVGRRTRRVPSRDDSQDQEPRSKIHRASKSTGYELVPDQERGAPAARRGTGSRAMVGDRRRACQYENTRRCRRTSEASTEDDLGAECGVCKSGGRTKLVDGVRSQVDLVTAARGDGVPVIGVLCFLEAHWPLIGGSLSVNRIRVVWPRLLIKQMAVETAETLDIDVIHAHLPGAFPTA